MCLDNLYALRSLTAQVFRKLSTGCVYLFRFRYKKWMEDFPIGTRHLLMNTANSCLGSTAVHRIQYKLNIIEPDVFPLLYDPIPQPVRNI